MEIRGMSEEQCSESEVIVVEKFCVGDDVKMFTVYEVLLKGCMMVYMMLLTKMVKQMRCWNRNSSRSTPNHVSRA